MKKYTLKGEMFEPLTPKVKRGIEEARTLGTVLARVARILREETRAENGVEAST